MAKYDPTKDPNTYTTEAVMAMSPDDRDAWRKALLASWEANAADADRRALDRDHERVGSYRRYHAGE